MRQVNKEIINATDAASASSDQIDSNQLINASFQIAFGDTHAAGTFKLQASNTVGLVGPTTFPTPSWTDIPNQSATITSGTSAILSLSNMAFRWIRAVYTSTANYTQVNTVTTVADVAGSLKSTYFTLTSVHGGVAKNFYVWFDNGAGVDPALPAKTGIKVTYSDNASANTLAGLIRAALNALTLDFVATGAGAAVISTNVEAGAATAAADGTAATGFTFANTNAGVNPTTTTVNFFAMGT